MKSADAQKYRQKYPELVFQFIETFLKTLKKLYFFRVASRILTAYILFSAI